MSSIPTSPTLEQSQPLPKTNPSEKLVGNVNTDAQANDPFLQYLVVRQSDNQPDSFKKFNTNFSSSIGSIVDRAPSSLFELKQQRILAAADRKKRIIARIVSFVGLLIIILCAAIVTFTLKMAPKIDELVRNKVGTHQSIPIVSRMNMNPSPTTIIRPTIRHENSTRNGSIIGKSILRT